jgi:DMSO/TMAO reductase YedYZ molybdopterin-dependent catalytic subunit
MDETMHPLALLTFGMYGMTKLAPPVRMVLLEVRLQSGIVKIRFTDKEPRTAWNKAAAQSMGSIRQPGGSTIPAVRQATGGQLVKTVCSRKA